MFTTNIDLWCFSFVTLFNLQGTRPSASAAEHVLSYHVVRLLSSTFFNFFEVFSALNAAFRRSLRQPIHFTRTAWVCQALFSLRRKFFRSRPQRFRRFSDSLNILPKLSRIVKNFFASLKTFLLSTLARPPRFRQLAYLTRFFLFCQHLFTYFRFFFSSSPTIYMQTQRLQAKQCQMRRPFPDGYREAGVSQFVSIFAPAGSRSPPLPS